MKTPPTTLLVATFALLSSAIAQAAPNWKPTFEDTPVPPENVAQIEDALPKEPIVQPKAARRVLVYSATAGYRHGSIPFGNLALEKLGKSTGAYEAVVSDDPANFEPEALRKFDAVILQNVTGDFFMPNKKRQAKYSETDWAALQERNDRLVDNLVDYVEEGGGLAGIHAATDACYDHEAYGKMIGGYFNGHPWSGRHNVTIVVEDPSHAVIQPVFGDVSDFRVQDEIYQFKDEPYSRERLRVLLHLDPARSDATKDEPKRKDNDYAVSWVQGVGKGRVFYSSLGHNPHIFWNPLILKHYLAGIQFATGDLEADTTPSAQASTGSR